MTTKRIVCIRWKSGDCKWQIDEPRTSLPRSAWERILERCRRFSPIVGLEPSDNESALLDITGLAHLFGGETALAEAIVRDCSQLGLAVRVAVADTIGAAWAAAPPPSPFVIIPSGKTPSFLAPLPVESLRLPGETVRLLNELGLTRIGQLEALPHEELSSRFGPALVRRLDQAFGRLDEPVPACPMPPTFEARWSAEWPTTRRETIDAVVEQLVGRVAATLNHCGCGALRVECRLGYHQAATVGRAVTGETTGRGLVIGLFQPTAAANHLFELLRLQLERLRIPSPVTDIHVAATLTAPLAPRRQAMLFDLGGRHTPCADPAHGVCGIQSGGLHFTALVERLGSRLGREAVLGVRLRPEAQPELSWHYDPLLGSARRRRVSRTLRVRNRHTACADYNGLPAKLPPRPLRLLPRPLLLAATSIAPDGPPLRFRHGGEEHKSAHAWGPERIETGWWRGRPVGRDYYRVETTAGRRFWLFRRLRDGKWFLHGSFD